METGNKEKAISFLKLSARGQAEEAFLKLVSDGFIHHNPNVEGSAVALMKALNESFRQNPTKVLEVKKIVAEDNLVAVRSVVKMNTDDRGAIVTHFFKFEDGLIAEMWDSAQPVPERSLNQYAMF